MNKLHVKCTDGGQHASAVIARFEWMPHGEAARVWDATNVQGDPGFVLEPITESTRGTKRGGSRYVQRQRVETHARTDGGVTFHLPACPRCGNAPRVRDVTLLKVLADGASSFDVSL